MKFRFNARYFILTVLLFLIEVLIALYMHDPFVRPYLGDVLVVMLIYCFVRSFVQAPEVPVALGVLAFSYVVETMQYFNIVKYLGLQQSRLANVVIGNHFTWVDILAYTVGIAITIAVEKWRAVRQADRD
ncbi:ribosomal maturation YjgA family protein [Chitinophaga cymbidii]|uniref:DUF2809 domain-containing protein n=1 Tax=Chitinophaga cymbidii TaxID=1096750 RepID=A0A512RT64_9BACT|nr:DUF2809 domain-containing protein [Chitinophaga cymbidii]GEP98889.1 hypothetical protein CCY01nite_51490 [Chitinophaga cymbidii]